MKSNTLGFILVCLGLSSTTQAQFIIQPTSVQATYISTGTNNVHDGNTNTVNIINGSGLSSPLATNAAIPATPTTVTATGAGVSQNLWLSGASGVQNDTRLTFDLGDTYNVSSILHWAQTESGVVTRRSIRTADIFVSLDNVDYVSAGSVTFLSNEAGPTPMQTGSFSGSFAGRYIRLQPTQNYANFLADGSGDNRYSINEVRFAGTAIPEPGAFAALAGLATLGFAIQRRRRRA